MGETPFSNFVQDLQNLLNRYGACITVQADEVTSKPCVYLSMQLEPNVSIGWGFNRLPVVKNVEDR